MSRTLHIQLTPFRRSKRLVENGYYSVPPGGDAINSSEDDDNLSIHSNSSMYSERSVKYRESPPIGTRRRRFRKLAGDSPPKRVVQSAARFSRESCLTKKVVTSTSSTLPRAEPPYSKSMTQLERRHDVLTTETSSPLMPPTSKNMSAGDRVDIRTSRTEQVLVNSIYSTANSRKAKSDEQFALQSIVAVLHQFLVSLVGNAVYSISKIVYLTALTVYSWEVKVLAWRVGAVPWRIVKYLFFLLVLLVAMHIAAKHGIGEEYMTISGKAVSRGFHRFRSSNSKASGAVPTTVTSNQHQEPLLHSQDFEAALTKMEVAFAFKLSEMKDVIQSLQDDSDKTRQELKNFENMQENTDSKINSLQAHFEEQQKESDTLHHEVTNLQNSFQVASQEYATKKELTDRAMAFSAQLLQLNDLIKSMAENYDGKIGNETRVREIITIEFVESFLAILRSTEASDENAGHVQAMLLSWLNKHGYVTKQDVDSDLRSLQGLYATKLERVRQDARRHSSTITLEKIVERPITEPKQGAGSDMEAQLRRWIQEALALYSADRIGLADHALESAGGFIAGTRCSESYDKKTALISILGIPFYYNINTPRSVIQPGNMPGECWSFKGAEGYVVIGLSGSVRPTSFSLEHIPRELSLAGHIESAPKNLVVLGLSGEHDEKGIVLGSYRYEQEGPVIQQFTKQTDNHEFFTHIELRIKSNWGNPTYTCLYRFRVHGERAGSKTPFL